MGRVLNIAIASVGGQGGLTLSRVLAIAAVLDGYSVRTGETLGMSQRFGSVVSYVRIGDRVFSPTFSDGEADYILGLEIIETVRALRLLKSGGVVIVSDVVKPPISASLSREVYSRSKLLEAIGGSVSTVVVPAQKLAAEVGNPRAANMVVLGVFHRLQSVLSSSSIKKAISEVVPSKWLESSLAAFELGVNYLKT
ncbi:MAG: indolepyruvate oxidoreductase subunit beta [Sulfolobales archaeon]|nr:indolepyruvate oxidoreductase subunit beta [Sulfolobales archaeon]MDW8082982.1 indolepyruvate oxidoreductase subunit beta [Sulfolobales archaeon]